MSQSKLGIDKFVYKTKSLFISDNLISLHKDMFSAYRYFPLRFMQRQQVSVAFIED